jgi:hypothetical protein
MRKYFIVVASLFVGLTHMNSTYGSVARSSYSASRPSSTASSGSTGLGVMFGEPTGLTLKHWLNSSNAVQFGLTYSFNNYFAIMGDYLWHFSTHSEFTPYAGIGAEIFFNTADGYSQRFRRDDTGSVDFAARIPLGVEWLPRKAPLGVFAEIVPAIGLIPGIYGFVQADIGVRFYL